MLGMCYVAACTTSSPPVAASRRQHDEQPRGQWGLSWWDRDPQVAIGHKPAQWHGGHGHNFEAAHAAHPLHERLVSPASKGHSESKLRRQPASSPAPKAARLRAFRPISCAHPAHAPPPESVMTCPGPRARGLARCRAAHWAGTPRRPGPGGHRARPKASLSAGLAVSGTVTPADRHTGLARGLGAWPQAGPARRITLAVCTAAR